MTQITPQDPHRWENNAKALQIGEHTRHYLTIIGRLEDTFSEIYELVEATGETDPDSCTTPLVESFCTFRNGVQKLMFDHITENLGCIINEI